MNTRTIAMSLLAAAVITGGALSVSHSARADQPRMQEALDALKTAERELEAATADKGGHRVAALKHTRAAIREVEAGINFDRRH